MPMQQSTMVPLGTPMPAFALPDVVSGQTLASGALDARKPVLVLFICAHCPFTQQIGASIRSIARDFRDRVNLVAISANDPAQVPQDSPDGLKRLAEALDLRAPFLFDQSQAVAAAFGAECTPECFLFDDARRLVYRGQIDTARRGPAGETPGGPLRAALDALLGGQTIDPNQPPGLGCNIKWRAGARPAAGAAR